MLKPAMGKLLRERQEALQEATDAYHDAVTEAWKAGATLGEIARELGSSHQHIGDLLARLGVRRKWRSLVDANRELDRREWLEREEGRKPK